MPQPPEEWLRQADYDMDTADHMFGGGRYFYAVFMCHLSIEKALKGFTEKKLNQDPPRVHNLILLAEQSQHQTTGAHRQVHSETE